MNHRVWSLRFACAWLAVLLLAPVLWACPGDADGDGVCDDLDTCPNTIAAIVVDTQGCPPSAPGDFDRDGDVDLDDWLSMEPCLSGPGAFMKALPVCEEADFDLDSAVGLDDAMALQRCFSGQGLPADPDCIGHSAVVGMCLRIVGTAAASHLSLRLQPGDSTVLEIDVGDDGVAEFSLSRGSFSCVQVYARGGNDLVRIDESNGIFSDTQPTSIDGGWGTDEITGGTGPETLSGSDGHDFILGKGGDDLVQLGPGDDEFRWDPGDGSDTVEGQDGDDTLLFHGSGASEVVNLSSNIERLRLLRNVGNVMLDCNELETVVLRMFGGSDNVTVAGLATTHVRRVDVDLAAAARGGDGSADNVTVHGGVGPFSVQLQGTNGAAEVAGLAALVHVEGGEPNVDVLTYIGGGEAILAVGSDGDDSMDITRQPSSSALSVTLSTATVHFDVFNVSQLTLNGLGGADTLTSAGDIFGLGIPLVYDGGDGDDTIHGGNGADLLIGGDGNDFVDGNQGADLALLGAGDDTFNWDPGDGSDTIEGQDDTDTLRVNGSNASEAIDVSANGGRLRFFRNIGNALLDGDGLEQVDYAAAGAADTIIVNDLSPTDVAEVNVDLAASAGGTTGDAVVDTVTVLGRPQADTVHISGTGGAMEIAGLSAAVFVTGGELTDVLNLNGGAGDVVHIDGTDDTDVIGITRPAGVNALSVSSLTFSMSVAVSGVGQVVVNTFAGEDTINSTGDIASLGIPLTYDGGDDDDVLLGSNGVDLLIGGDGLDFIDGNQGADLVLMGLGNDTFRWDPGDGSDTVEGQDGIDTLQVNTNNASEAFDLSANGVRLRFFRNIGSAILDCDGVERVFLGTAGGTDTVTVNSLAGTEVTEVNIDLAASPGGLVGDLQADSVTVQGTPGDDVILVASTTGVAVAGLSAAINILLSEAANDRLVINALAGDDSVDASGLLAGFIQLTIDGGDDHDVLIGSDGADVILGGDGDDVLLGGPGLDVLDGGPGNNAVIQ